MLDPTPKRRYKRFSPAVLDRLKALEKGNPEEVLMQALISLQAAPFSEVYKAANMDAAQAEEAAAGLLASGQMVLLARSTRSSQKPGWQHVPIGRKIFRS